MKIRALKLTVEIGRDDLIYLGPFFTRRHDAILRRIPSLLRATYFKGSVNENPDLVDKLLATFRSTISDCNTYDAYCFASARPEHARYFSVSRRTRDLSALRTLIGSGESGSGADHFFDREKVRKKMREQDAGNPPPAE